MVQASQQKFGIYLNRKERKVLRVNSPYWFPPAPEWVLVTPEVNATLLQVRQMAGEKKMVDKPEEIVWGSFPAQP